MKDILTNVGSGGGAAAAPAGGAGGGGGGAAAEEAPKEEEKKEEGKGTSLRLLKNLTADTPPLQRRRSPTRIWALACSTRETRNTLRRTIFLPHTILSVPVNEVQVYLFQKPFICTCGKI